MGACRIRLAHIKEEITLRRDYYRQAIAIRTDEEGLAHPDRQAVAMRTDIEGLAHPDPKGMQMTTKLCEETKINLRIRWWWDIMQTKGSWWFESIIKRQPTCMHIRHKERLIQRQGGLIGTNLEWRGAYAHSRGWIEEETILEELTGMTRRYKIAQCFIALRIRAQRESTLKKAMRTLWTTDTIETILILIPHDERTIPACINRIWASTVKMLQEYRQRQWKRIFLGVTGLYTWRSHVVDIKVMHNLNQTQDTDRLTKRMTIVSQNLSSASRHMTGTFRTEKGALLNTIKISIYMALAYLIEDGGPDYYRRMVVMNGILFRTGDINHLLNNPQTYPEQSRSLLDHDELDDRTMMYIYSSHDWPYEINHDMRSLNISTQQYQHYMDRNRNRMERDQGITGYIFRQMTPDTSSSWARRTCHRLRECEAHRSACSTRLIEVEEDLIKNRDNYRQIAANIMISSGYHTKKKTFSCPLGILPSGRLLHASTGKVG